MKSDLASSSKSGVALCAEAFERLKAGAPIVPAHVGLPASKTTSGIVSVEAGFDRGYLKKSRPTHMPLIAQIEAYRLRHESDGESKANQIKRAQSKVVRAETELDQARRQLYEVLTQNLQLVERVRELETLLASKVKVGKVLALHEIGQ